MNVRRYGYLIISLFWILPICLAGEPAPGLIVPEGFHAEKFAGDDLAHDIYTIVADDRGDPIVSGPGYIKRLFDENSDGTADRAELLSEFPKDGAHGLCIHPDGLLVNGHNKLTLLRDQDGDGRFEARETWAELKSTEHGGNNIVRGPDGWYYVACGNDAGVTASFPNTDTSPIKSPVAGVILRFSPDGKKREIVADGFRNPYGLAFSTDGVLWTYDSDNERDQYLPWYCPTRIFQVRLGGHHGWVNGGWQNGWNRPECWPEVVPRHRELGRGSPTGVVTYTGTRWPAKYREKVLAACWSRGRIYQVDRDVAKIPDPHELVREEEFFVRPASGAALAIVGMAFGRNDDLYVAVGGRKTQGTVYRIVYDGDARLPAVINKGREFAVPLVPAITPDQVKLAQVREWQKVFGEVPNRKILPEVFQGYAADRANSRFDERVTAIEAASKAYFAHTFNDRPVEESLAQEYARLFAIAESQSPSIATSFLTRITPKSTIETDLHYLICFARMNSPRDDEQSGLTVDAVLGLHHKLRAAKAIPSRHWPLRVGELYRTLVDRDPRLPQALAGHKLFCLPEQTLFIEQVPTSDRAALAKALISRIDADAQEDWTPELLTTTRYLPRAEAVGYLREQWEEPSLRDAATLELASKPEATDRDKFIAALSGFDTQVIQASLGALHKITPVDHAATQEELTAILSAIKGLYGNPGAAKTRYDAAELFARWTNLPKPANESPKINPAEHYAIYFDWLRKKYPDAFAKLDATAGDVDSWVNKLGSIPFDAGDAVRGRKVFETLQCARCHAGAGHLGPDLKGVSSRFTRKDLLTAIVDPNRDVAPTYQTKSITTPDGKTTIGIVIYESPETTMVVVGPDVTVQLQGATPAMIRPNRNSLMPTGLLNRASEQDVADLFRYVQELK